MHVATTRRQNTFLVAFGSILLCIILAMLLVLLKTPERTLAADATKFQPGNIISDPVFTDTSTMSAASIQAFLNTKVPTCDTNGAQTSEFGGPDLNGDGRTQRWEWGKANYNQTKFVCLKDYRQDGKSAAEIIYNAAQEFSINPQVLIVLLQKEQTLVTDTWPLNIQYRSATGYGCPDTAPCDSEYYGLTNQIRWAARMFRSIMNDSPGWYTPYELGGNQIPWHPNTGSCGYSTVTIQNRATQALYNYTPYRPNQAALNAGYGQGNSCSSYGNRNFYLYFTDWFGSTLRTNNIKLILCEDQKYLVERGISRKRLITDAALGVWQFPEEYFIVNDPACNFTTYDEDLGRLIRSRDSGKVYLVDNGHAYVIGSQSTANAWGFGTLSTSVFPQFDADSMKDNLIVNQSLSRVVSSTNESRTDVYLIDGGERYEIAGSEEGDYEALILLTGQGASAVNQMSVDVLQTLPGAEELNYAFRSDGRWYLLDRGSLKKVGQPSQWNNSLHGPILSNDVLGIFDSQKTLAKGFQNEEKYYKLNGTDTLSRTPDRPVAENWQVQNEPTVSSLLGDKILESLSAVDDFYALNGNVRLIQCGDTKYIIERHMRFKRVIGEEFLADWGLTDKYFFLSDKGCSYPLYSMEAGELIRSRDTKRVYYVSEQYAYLVESAESATAWGFGDVDSQTYPLITGKSIHDLFTVVRQLPPPETP